MRKHTKGPWIYCPNSESIFRQGTHDAIAYVEYPVGCDEEATANAKLIAAAPELLEALKKAIPYLEDGVLALEESGDYQRLPSHYHFYKKARDNARAAIEKAEG